MTYPQATGGPVESVSFQHNMRNQLTHVTDGRGLVTEYRMDGFGDLIRLVSPESGTTDFWYDEAGNLEVDSRDVDGITVSRTRTYDHANRMTSLTSAPGSIVKTWVYDMDGPATFANQEGRLASVSDSTGKTTYGYDVFGRLDRIDKEIVSSAGTQTFELDYDYDAVGNLTSMTYPSGRRVNYLRSGGRITAASWTAAGGGTPNDLASAFDYFPFGGPDDFTFGNGFVRDRERDTSQRLVSEHVVYDPGGGSEATLYRRNYEYDAFDQIDVIRRFDPSDPFNLAAAIEETLGYDQRHRLASAIGPYGDFSYQYDASDNRLQRTFVRPGETNPVVETYQIEASSNRLNGITIDDPIVGTPYSRDLQHDSRGSITADVRSPAERVTFEYDDLGRMDGARSKVVPEPGVALMIGAGSAFLAMLRRRKRGQAVSRDRPDRSFRVLIGIFVVMTLAADSALAQDSDGDQIPDAFEMATQGHPSNLPLDYLNPVDGSLDFDGDGFDNTTEYLNFPDPSNISLWDRCDTPDPNGPKPYIDSIATDVSEIIVSGDVTVTWSTGCATEVRLEPLGVVSSSGSQIFSNVTESTWFTLIATNAHGFVMQSTEVEVVFVDADYEYNAANQRVRTLVADASNPNGAERLYVYGPDGLLLSELEADGTPVVEYVYLDGEPLAQIHGDNAAEQTRFVHTSHLGTPEILTDDSRAAVWTGQTSPFGDQIQQTGGASQKARFPGHYADAGLGINYNWHRYYDPSIGRYLQADPIGQAGGMNVFAYARNNPVAFIDPSGLTDIVVDDLAKLVDKLPDGKLKDRAKAASRCTIPGTEEDDTEIGISFPGIKNPGPLLESEEDQEAKAKKDATFKPPGDPGAPKTVGIKIEIRF